MKTAIRKMRALTSFAPCYSTYSNINEIFCYISTIFVKWIIKGQNESWRNE